MTYLILFSTCIRFWLNYKNMKLTRHNRQDKNILQTKNSQVSLNARSRSYGPPKVVNKNKWIEFFELLLPSLKAYHNNYFLLSSK